VGHTEYKLISYAITSDTAAFSSLAVENSLVKFLLFISMHSIASVIISFVLYNMLPSKYKKQKKSFIYIFIFLFVFFIPFISYIGFFVFNKTLKQNKKEKKAVFKHIEIEKLLTIDEIQFVKRVFGEGALTTYIKNRNLNPELRLKAFLVVSEIISPVTVEFLKFGLSDTVDEIRLLSFSLINNLEKKINNEIFKIKELLKKNDDAELRFKTAKLNWELIYLRLADETFENIIIKDIFKYLEGLDTKEANLLRLKIYLLKKEFNEIEKILSKLEINIETAPYFMELAYYKRDFETLKKLIKQYPEIRFVEKFYFIYRLWNDN
jgi:hypothetical protein